MIQSNAKKREKRRQNNNILYNYKKRTKRIKLIIQTIIYIALFYSITFLNIRMENQKEIEIISEIHPEMIPMRNINMDLKYLDNITLMNTQGIVNYIKQVACTTGQKDYIIAWEIVSHFTEHISPLWDNWNQYPPYDWGHSPALMLNSLGFGICDDMATVLHALWRELGYSTRVWGLNGHTVSEIYVENKWQMYDADFKVYYHTRDLQVASVSELIADTSLVNNPRCPILDKNSTAYTIGYVYEIGQVVNDYTRWLPPDLPNFEIPPNVTIRKIQNVTIETLDSTRITTYGLQFYLPPLWNGTIAEPLILHSIQGNYTSCIISEGNFVREIEINTQSEVILTFLLNPKIQVIF